MPPSWLHPNIGILPGVIVPLAIEFTCAIRLYNKRFLLLHLSKEENNRKNCKCKQALNFEMTNLQKYTNYWMSGLNFKQGSALSQFWTTIGLRCKKQPISYNHICNIGYNYETRLAESDTTNLDHAFGGTTEKHEDDGQSVSLIPN